MRIEGTKETREFYDAVGWRSTQTGKTVDSDLFGVKEDGPLRVEMHERKWSRIREFLGKDSQAKVLEVGCGGSPEIRLLSLFDQYVGSDFSVTGLNAAKEKLSGFEDRTTLVETDAVSLPFDDQCFDAVYSAHMLYHMDNPEAQIAAIREMLRVLRPGGALVLQTANPRPLLFPVRLTMRVVADTPLLSKVARRLKGASPLPYNPQKLGWYLGTLDGCSTVKVFNGGIASTAFNQKVSESAGLGKLFWSLFNTLDAHRPITSAYLGNYAVVAARK